MSKILKNTTASLIEIDDTGVTLAASPATYTIPQTDYPLWAASSDIITQIGNGDVIVSDGSSNLSIADGTDLIKGIFANPLGVASGTTRTPIGNVGDCLKTSTTIAPGEDNPSHDSFGRFRVTQSQVAYTLRFINGQNPLLTTTNTVSGGTVTNNDLTSSADVNVTITNGSRALLQSKEYIQYTPGKTSQAYLAGRFSANSANRKQRLGCFDDNDGLFFEYESGILYSVTRTSVSGSPVDTRVASTDWNIDKMDGTGPSGITLNPELIQTYIIQFQWHGSGMRIWGLSLNNTILFVHKQSNANVGTNPWAKSADFPIRGEVVNTATAANTATLRIQSFVALTEGADFNGNQRHAVSRSTNKAVNTSAFIPCFSVRLKAAFNRGSLKVIKVPVLSTSTDNLEIRLILNPTLTAASWTSAGTNSIAEFDESATAASGGEVLSVFYAVGRGTSQVLIDDTLLKLVADYSGTADILTLAVKSIDNAATVRAGMVFLENF